MVENRKAIKIDYFLQEKTKKKIRDNRGGSRKEIFFGDLEHTFKGFRRLEKKKEAFVVPFVNYQNVC